MNRFSSFTHSISFSNAVSHWGEISANIKLFSTHQLNGGLAILSLYFFSMPVAHATCDDLNYADEFVVSNFQLVSQEPIDADWLEITLSADIQNTDGSELDNTTAFLDLTANTLEVATEEEYFQALEFGLVGPLASVSSDIVGTNLVMRVAAADLANLMIQLNDGTIPIVVNGSESLVLQPDVYAFAWHESADLNYAGVQQVSGDSRIYHEFDSTNAIFQNNAELSNLNWTFDPDAGRCLGIPAAGQQFYVWENGLSGEVDADGIISGLTMPIGIRHGALTAASYFENDGGFNDSLCASNAAATNLIEVTILDALTWDIQSAIKRGAFCTGESAFLDQPVAQTRFIVSNGVTEQPLDAEPGAENPENLQRDVQPMRINNLQVGDLRINGQIQGYALKPRLVLRVKPQGVEIRSSVESDLNMALQVTADTDVNLADAQNVQIGQLCFPLPPIPVGFALLESSLDLAHTLDISANMHAGMTFGIEKQFRGGYITGWDPARAAGEEFFSDTFFTERPLSLTPPRLLADTSAAAEVGTNFMATLRIGGSLCQYAGPFVRARLAANVQVSPLATPAWSLGHEASLEAGLTLDLLGINLLEKSAPLVTFPGSESLSAAKPSKSQSKGNEIDTETGIDQRWAINVQDLTGPGGKIWVSDSDATADGGLVAVTSNGRSGGQERLLRFDTAGQLLWDKQYAGISTRVSDVYVRDDGNIIVAGDLTSSTGMWLALHDPEGDEIWNRTFQLTNEDGDFCTLDRLIGFRDANDVEGIVLAGTSGSTTDQTARACVLRLDENGEPLWSKVAGELTFSNPSDGAEWLLHDVIHTRDDGFLLVGYFHYFPDGDFQTTKPIATKLDDQGNVIWESQFVIPSPSARIGAFKAVTQSPSGEFYLTGSVGGTVLQTGGMLVAQLSEDGATGKGAILYYTRFNQGSTEDANNDPNHWSYSDDVAASGNDSGLDIVSVEGGAVVSGVLGVNDEAWIIRVNEHLGVEWFNSYDGIFSDSINSLNVTDTGIYAAGISQSIIPNSVLAGKATLMLMKLPFEGLVNDFYPTLDIYRRYVLPTVFQGPDFYDNSPMIHAELSVDPLPLIAGIVTDLGANTSLLGTPSTLCASVLTANSGIANPVYLCDEDADGIDDIIDNCPDDANADQLDQDGDGEGDACDLDIDGDGLNNEGDNCSLVSNPNQVDADADGIGNTCDPDLNNDCAINIIDQLLLRSVFFSSDPTADFNVDGIVNFGDRRIMRKMFFGTPGPSGLPNICET